MMVSRRYGVTSVVQVCTTSNQRAAFGTHVTVKGPDRIDQQSPRTARRVVYRGKECLRFSYGTFIDLMLGSGVKTVDHGLFNLSSLRRGLLTQVCNPNKVSVDLFRGSFPIWPFPTAPQAGPAAS